MPSPKVACSLRAIDDRPYDGKWILCEEGSVGRQNSDPNNPSPPAAELPLHKGAFRDAETSSPTRENKFRARRVM